MPTIDTQRALIATLGAALLLGHSAVAMAAPPSGAQWKMTWNDEFDGTAVDQTKWSFWLDGQTRRAAINRASNTFVSNGVLTVRITNAGGTLTAGGLQSKSGFGYGYYEVRAQVKGGWATFWMQSPAIGPGDPAVNGTEMDIEEACCPGAVQHAVHWNGYGAEHQFVTHAIGSTLVPNQQNWNVYGLEWEPGVYKFWVNDQLSWTFTTAVSARNDEWIRLTQETNGDYCGGECLYNVDYVRVYQKTSDTDAGTAGSGGRANTGGTANSGGTSNTGGTKSTGGTTSTGGAKSTGGASNSGGSSTGGAATGGVNNGGAAAAGAAGNASGSASDSGSCGCHLPGGRSSPMSALVAALGLVLVRRSRRRN